MRREVRDWTSREHLREYLDLQPEVEDGRVLALRWDWSPDKKRVVQCGTWEDDAGQQPARVG